MDGQTVSDSAVTEKLQTALAGVLPVGSRVKGQQRGKLFNGERIFFSHAVLHAQDDFRIRGNGNAGHFGNLQGTLAHDSGIDGFRAGTPDNGLQLFLLLTGYEVTALTFELGNDLIPDTVLRDDALFRGADGAVVKGFAGNDPAHRIRNVGRSLNIGRDISGADPQGGCSAGVGRLDHGTAAGGNDHVAELHQLVRAAQGGNGHHGDQTIRRTGLHGGRIQDPDRLPDTVQRGGVRGDDQGVACLDGDQCLENGGAGGIGAGNQTGHDADRHRDFQHLLFGILPDDPDGFFILDKIVNGAGRKQILCDFVVFFAKAGIADGHLRQFLRSLFCGRGHGGHDTVHLLLVHFSQHRLGGFCFSYQVTRFLNGGKVLVQFHGVRFLSLSGMGIIFCNRFQAQSAAVLWSRNGYCWA